MNILMQEAIRQLAILSVECYEPTTKLNVSSSKPEDQATPKGHQQNQQSDVLTDAANYGQLYANVPRENEQ